MSKPPLPSNPSTWPPLNAHRPRVGEQGNPPPASRQGDSRELERTGSGCGEAALAWRPEAKHV